MAEVLTQEEINALLSQFSKEEEMGQKSRVSEPGSVDYAVYDFKRPNRFRCV